jgi:hypothetical protein
METCRVKVNELVADIPAEDGNAHRAIRSISTPDKGSSSHYDGGDRYGVAQDRELCNGLPQVVPGAQPPSTLSPEAPSQASLPPRPPIFSIPNCATP